MVSGKLVSPHKVVIETRSFEQISQPAAERWYSGGVIRPPARVLLSCFVAALSGTEVACGGDSGGAGQADAATAAPDASPGSRCGAPSPARAVVAGEFLDQGDDRVAVLRFENGQLFDDGNYFPLPIPRRIAIRGDGREAMVAFGGFNQPFGVAVFSLEDGGARAALVDTVEVGGEETPFDVAYVGADHAVLATASPSLDDAVPGYLFPLAREADGGFAAGAAMAIAGNWPLQTLPRPGHDGEVLLTRANLIRDAATQVMRVALDARGAPAVIGEAGEIGPPTLDVATTGDLVYGATADADESIAADNLDAPGALHTLAIAGETMDAVGELALPGVAHFVEVDPRGRFLVTDTAVYEVDPAGRPDATASRITTVALDDAGMPRAVIGQTEPFTMGIYNSFALTATGELITAIEMFPDQAPAAELHPIVVWAQPRAGEWERCQTVHREGQIVLAVAP